MGRIMNTAALDRSFREARTFRLWIDKPVSDQMLQGAYLVLAARALGLDCGPMPGFDSAKVDAAFFPDGRTKSNFLCSLGYGDPAELQPRNPRLAFAEACEIR